MADPKQTPEQLLNAGKISAEVYKALTGKEPPKANEVGDVANGNQVAQGNDNQLLGDGAVNVDGDLKAENANIQTGGEQDKAGRDVNKAQAQNIFNINSDNPEDVKAVIDKVLGTRETNVNQDEKLDAASDAVLTTYLQHMIKSNRYLRLQGIQSAKEGTVSIKLEQIYVTLRTKTATLRHNEREQQQWLEMEKELALGERHRSQTLDNVGGMATINVNLALRERNRLAIIGDPGSGKTTLLSYLALIYARDLGQAIHKRPRPTHRRRYI